MSMKSQSGGKRVDNLNKNIKTLKDQRDSANKTKVEVQIRE